MAPRSVYPTLLCLLAVPAAFATQPWDEPFSPALAAIVKAAAAVPISNKAEAIVLLEDRHYEIQQDGQTTTTLRRVYRVAKQTAVEDWSVVEQPWEPWHENKPELRARVISPDASVHWLDPKTIADAPAAQFDATIFSDSRLIRAPLPAVAEGAVIEYQVVQHATAPLAGAGITRALTVANGVPMERFHVVIDAAQGIILHTGSSLIPPSSITRSDSKGLVHVNVELGRQEPNENADFFVPPDQPVYPSFRFSTGASWQRVAALYQKIVAERMDAAESRALISALAISGTQSSEPQEQIASKWTAQLHERVRYTGVEFGEAAILPNKPMEVLNRHYGDCKDKATLLVAMLRAAGLDAHIALLQVAEPTDIDPDLPGFGLFNHAIVFVAGRPSLRPAPTPPPIPAPAPPPIWIDATADNAAVGELPISDQGRHALIIDSSTNGLVTTPQSSSGDNRIVHNIEIHLGDSGKGNIRETIHAYGSFALQLRSRYSGDQQQIRSALEFFVKNSFGAKSVGEFSVSERGDFSKPFQLNVEARETNAAVTGLQQAATAVSNSFLFESLPFALLTRPAQDSAEEKPRTHDFVFPQPYQAEVHFKLFPPAGFAPKKLPTPESTKTGDATYSSQSKKNQDGTVELDYIFNTGKRRLTPAEFSSLRVALISPTLTNNSEVVEFTLRSNDLLALGEVAEALRVVRAGAASNPHSGLAQMRLAQVLMNSGAGEAAVRAAQKGVELDAKSSQAWQILAFAYERDSFGRLRVGDWNRAEAEKALRKAMALDESDQAVAAELAILLEYGPSGDRYGKEARMNESVGLYRQILKKGPNPGVSQNLTVALIQMGRYREAQQEAKSLTLQPAYPVLSTTLTALMEDPEHAIIYSQTSYADPEARAANLSGAAATLRQVRQYEAATQLSKAAVRLTSNPAVAQQSALDSKVKRYPDLLFPANDPRLPVQRLLVLIASSQENAKDLDSILSKRANAAVWQSNLEKMRGKMASFRSTLRSQGAIADIACDILLSSTTLEKAGSGEPVFRINVISPLNTGLSTTYVVQEDGQYRLLATNDALDSLGAIALDELAKGNLSASQAWLDAARESAIPIRVDDDKGPAFRYLWDGVAPETRNATYVRAAAASLLGTYAGSEQAIATLRSIAAHPVQYMQSEDLDFAICEALNKAGKWQQLLAASQSLSKSKMFGPAGFNFASEAQIQLGQWKGMLTASESRLKINAKDHPALQFAALASMHLDEWDKAALYLKRAEDSPYGGHAKDKLLESWNAILAAKVTDAAVSTLDSGTIGSSMEQSAEYLYTLALTQLFHGKPDDCIRTFMLALDKEDPKQISSLAWLVQGEMMKHYSLDDLSQVAFAKARAAIDGDEFHCAELLLRRDAKTSSSSH